MKREEAIDIILNDVNTHTIREGIALNMAIKALEQEPCDNAISKAELKKMVRNLTRWNVSGNNKVNVGLLYDDVMFGIDGLRSVQPKVKTGRWVQTSPAKIYECSECGQTVMTDDIECYHYCHRCGAKMEDR